MTPNVCYQLEQPVAEDRLASERITRSNVDPISYADTAITMPAPRLTESEVSYAPWRRSNTGVLVPVVLCVALLAGGVIGYLRFAPTSHMQDEQPALAQQQASATSPPTAAVAPAQPPAAPAAAAQQPESSSQLWAAASRRTM